jgi:hypothetical protein
MLHPTEPRCAAEVQFTNRRICIFTKHKRYKKRGIPGLLYHETLHIVFHWLFKKRYSYLDDALDLIDYRVTKAMLRKRIVKEKGWAYFKKTRHPLQLGVRPHD